MIRSYCRPHRRRRFGPLPTKRLDCVSRDSAQDSMARSDLPELFAVGHFLSSGLSLEPPRSARKSFKSKPLTVSFLFAQFRSPTRTCFAFNLSLCLSTSLSTSISRSLSRPFDQRRKVVLLSSLLLLLMASNLSKFVVTRAE